MKLDRKQRVVYGWLILTLFILILAGRLAWVQLVMKHQRMPGSNHTMIEASLYQRERGVVLDSGRGHFTDRYGQPLTGHLIWTAVLFPMNKAEWSEAQPKLRQLSDILNTDYDALTDQWHKSHEPILWHAQSSPVPTALSSEQIARIHELKLEYIQVLPYQQRYPAGLSGMQWLGYVSGQRKENLFYKDDPEIKGNSGLEKALDPIIRGDEPTIVYFPVNGGNHVIQDMEPMVKASSNPYYPLRVQSTIDAGMQQAIEDLTEKANMGKGAVVVLDARNADILAMVSRPFYNPEDIHPEAGNGRIGRLRLRCRVQSLSWSPQRLRWSMASSSPGRNFIAAVNTENTVCPAGRKAAMGRLRLKKGLRIHVMLCSPHWPNG